MFIISASCAAAQPVASDSDGLLFLATEASASVSAVSAVPAVTAVTAVTASPGALPFFLDEQTASMPIFPSDPMGASLRIISSLFVVIIIAFGLSWFLQRKVGLGGNVFGKVLGILPIDNKRMIYLVDVMGKVLILGVTDSNINLLCEITDKDTLDSLRLQYEKPAPGMERLFSFLRPANNESEERSFIPDNQETRNQDRLRKLNDLLVKRNNKDDDRGNQ